MNLHKQGKVWGQTQPLFNKNNVEIHRIETNKGGFCSKHKHEFKYNCFYVEKGKLKINDAQRLIDHLETSLRQSTYLRNETS